MTRRSDACFLVAVTHAACMSLRLGLCLPICMGCMLYWTLQVDIIEMIQVWNLKEESTLIMYNRSLLYQPNCK